MIRDDNDYQRHVDYVHWNPVKHGHVQREADWPHFTFHRWVERGIYDRHWGSGITEPPAFADLEKTVGER